MRPHPAPDYIARLRRERAAREAEADARLWARIDAIAEATFRLNREIIG